MEEKKKSHSKKWLWWAVPVLLIVLLIFGGRQALKSDWLFDIVRNMAVEQVNNQLNGTLSIESVRGDLLHGFSVYNIHLKGTDENDIARIDSASVRYNISSLIRSAHTIDDLTISGLNAFIEQDQDSVWNVMKLIDEPEEEPEESELFWTVENLTVNRANIHIKSDFLLPDGELDIEDINTESSAGVNQNGFFGTIKQLDLSIREQRLPEPIEVYLAGSSRDDRLTLESMVLQTGRTFLEAEGQYQPDSELTAQATLKPLSRQDIALYLDDLPLQKDLNIELGAEGSLENMNISIFASAEGLDQIELTAGLSIEETLTVQSLSLSSGRINPGLVTGMEGLPNLESFSLTGSGTLYPDDLEASSWTGEIALQGFAFEDYRADTFNADYQITEGNGELTASASYRDELIRLTGSINNFLAESPQWNAEIRSDNLDIATWLNNPELESNLNIRANISGEGFDPDNFTTRADLNIAGESFGEQQFTGLTFNGTISQNRVEGFAAGSLERSRLEASFNIRDWLENPAYSFEIFMKEFNANELAGMEEFPTYLNGSFIGEGSSFDLETLELTAVVQLDSSHVNQEQIETFMSDLRVSNSALIIEEALLESPIADASFSLRQHIIDLTDPDNRLNFQATIKDLLPLAPLAGVELLQSSGNISGNMARNEQGLLEFNGNIDLEDTVVDTLFSSPKITASVYSLITDEPEIETYIDFTNPTFFDVNVQDVHLRAFAKFTDEETSGNIQYTITNGDESSLSQSGEFSIDSTRTFLRTHTLEFKTEMRTLSLAAPFNLTYSNEILSVDTLTISTNDDDSYLKLWAPHVDTLRQEIGLDARYLNVGALQSTFLEEAIFNGYLSGNIELKNSPDSLNISANGLLESFMYESGSMDSLRFSADLKDEWLDTELSLWHNNQQLAEASLRAPYLPGDPLTFDDQFFDRSIDGRFNLFESDINYWLSFTPDGGYEETEGQIAINGDLSGVAGNPELSGALTIGDGLFSGIRVDSVKIDMLYSHDNEAVELTGRITKDRQPILSFDAELPFLVDLRETEILLPDDDDEVFVNFRTDDFDLAIFNNYVDRELVRDIRGRLRGEVTLSGILADLQTNGQMELTRGRMRLVPAGITLEEISSRVAFRQDRLELQQFTMQSGPGNIRASGFVELQNLTPGNLQINVRGNQFRIINTPVYNAIINTNATLSGTAEEPNLSGSLTFLRGFVNLQNFGERAVEDVVLEDEEEPEPLEFYDALTLDMNVNFTRQFFIRNRQYLDMEIELGGQVDLQKQPFEDLQMFGELEGLQGFARPLGKNFQLDEARVSFYGPIDNPELNIITRFDPPQAQAGVRIFYIIEGTVQDPEFRFDSEPELELQDIISYTIFGKPFYELESWEQVVAGSGSSPSPADIALDVLLDRVEMLAAQRLGIDVVQIDNSRSGSGSSTSIKTGWYLNQRTFFAILNEVGGSRPKTLFMIEYLLMENLELLITQGDDPRQGIDLRWRKDY